MNPITKPSQDTVSLADCRQDQTCRILALTGDLACKLHLVNLGFHTDSHLKLSMIRNQCYIVSVDGSRFALDASLAKNIQVQLLS